MRFSLNKIKVPQQIAGRGATNPLFDCAYLSELWSKVKVTREVKVVTKIQSAGKFDDTRGEL